MTKQFLLEVAELIRDHAEEQLVILVNSGATGVEFDNGIAYNKKCTGIVDKLIVELQKE